MAALKDLIPNINVPIANGQAEAFLLATEAGRSNDGIVANVWAVNGTSRWSDVVKLARSRDRERFAATANANTRLFAEEVVAGLLELQAKIEEETQRPRQASTQATEEIPYWSNERGTFYLRPTPSGTAEVQLADFSARIVEDRFVDYGTGAEERRHEYVIEVWRNGQSLGRTRVPVSEFGKMNWVAEKFGQRAHVLVGPGGLYRLRVAIELESESENATTFKVVYGHVGWTRIQEKWAYLHREGAITEDGMRTDVEVEPGIDTGGETRERLALFRLRLAGDASELAAAISATLRLLDARLAPDRISMPLFGASFLAPLQPFVRPHEPDFSIVVHGPTGSLKTSYASGCWQTHFGDYTYKKTPLTFSTTPVGAEIVLATLRDAPCVVDDNYPTKSRKLLEEMRRVMAVVLRSRGNLHGKIRGQQDLRIRRELVPRALPILTVEKADDDTSGEARSFFVEVRPGSAEGETPGDIDLKSVMAAQTAEQRRLYTVTMGTYIHWVASNAERLASRLPVRYEELLAELQGVGSHSRQPGVVAFLLLAIETAVSFFTQTNALSEDAAAELLRRAREALLQGAEQQGVRLRQGSPPELAIQLLRTAFRSRRLYLEDARTGEAPANATAWGWSHETRNVDGEQTPVLAKPAGSHHGGWAKEGYVLLLPEAAYAAINRLHREARNGDFPVPQSSLWRAMDDRGFVVGSVEKRKNKPSVRRSTVSDYIPTIGANERVVKIPLPVLEDVDNEAPSPQEAGRDSTEEDPGDASESACHHFTTDRAEEGRSVAGNAAAAAIAELEDVLRDCRELDVGLSVTPEGRLVVTGAPRPDLARRISARMADLIAHLRIGAQVAGARSA